MEVIIAEKGGHVGLFCWVELFACHEKKYYEWKASKHFPVVSQQKHYRKLWNMFKVNNKNTLNIKHTIF